MWMLVWSLALLSGHHWVGTWATAAQPANPGPVRTFKNQTLRLIVHTSIGGPRVRIKISNTYGDRPLEIGAAHIARRASDADIDPASDRPLKFNGKTSATIAPHAMAVSDPVDLAVSPLSDLAVTLFLPDAEETTSHILAKQTNFIADGDLTGAARFPADKKIRSWPFLTGVDVEAPRRAAAIVAFGSSLTDGDGTTRDTNHRFPDFLAARLQKAGAERGVLNEGIIGNRLLADSPAHQPGFPFGSALGEAGMTRYQRDVLDQSGARYVIVGLGVNDILFPGSFTPASEMVSADSIIAAYRQLIARSHQKNIRVIGTTLPPFENSFFKDPPLHLFTPEKEALRVRVNEWILHSGAFDSVVDLDQAVRDPNHPAQIRPDFDSGDHLHPNDAGCEAEANAFPLALFGG